MERAVRSGERHGYAAAVADLWEPLSRALVRLERIAEATPDEIVSDARDELPGLQYTLHRSAELALGLDPPPRAAPAHAELVDALAQARESTAEISFAVEEFDEDLVEKLLPEWRGALFRVRLARLRAPAIRLQAAGQLKPGRIMCITGLAADFASILGAK